MDNTSLCKCNWIWKKDNDSFDYYSLWIKMLRQNKEDV